MKKCINCGIDMADDCQFCPNCGAAVEINQDVAPVTNYQFNPVISMINRCGSSSLFLVSIISFGCYILFNFISSIMSAVNISNSLDNFYYGFSSYDVGSIASASVASAVIGSIIGIVLPVLIFIGMLMFYLQCKKNLPVIRCNGLSMVKVSYTITYILGIIVLGICFIFLLLMFSFIFISDFKSVASELIVYFEQMFNMNFYINSLDLVTVFTIILSTVMIILVISLVFEIIYGAKILKSIKKVSNAAQTGTYPEPVSMFVIVMNYIVAGLSLISLPVGFTFITFLGKTAFIIFLIMISLTMQKYNREVNSFVSQMIQQ